MKAKAKIKVDLLPYKSIAEKLWATFGRQIIETCPGVFEALGRPESMAVLDVAYEPETFNIPGGKYTPDFRFVMACASIVFIEVKASKRQRNYRDARSKLRAAAELNPWYTWVEVRLRIRRGAIETCDIEVIG